MNHLRRKVEGKRYTLSYQYLAGHRIAPNLEDSGRHLLDYLGELSSVATYQGIFGTETGLDSV
jgi:hypothetical protein